MASRPPLGLCLCLFLCLCLSAVASPLSLLMPAAANDGFLVANATPATNASRLAFSLVPAERAYVSTVARSARDPSVVELVVALSRQRLALLGLRLTSDARTTTDSVVYARELVVRLGAPGGVAVDWDQRLVYFAENVGATLRVVSLDRPDPVPLDHVPVLARLPPLWGPYGTPVLGSLVLDAERDTLYLGVGAAGASFTGRPVLPAVWSLRTDGSGLSLARNLTGLDYSAVSPPVFTLSAPTRSGSPPRLVVTTLNPSGRYYDLTSFDLPLTPDSGNGTQLAASVGSSPRGVVADGQGWLYLADQTQGVTRLRTNGTDRTQHFVTLSRDDPLVAVGLVPETSVPAAIGGRLLLPCAKTRFYAAPLRPPTNLTVLAVAQSAAGLGGLAMDAASCRMWYLDGGRLVSRRADDWRPAAPVISQYTYATSNLALDARRQLYFARNFPNGGQILRVEGDPPSGADGTSVLISSFGLQSDGRRLATDPVARKFYYVADGVLFRSELDGSGAGVYVRTRSGTLVSAFALDLKRRLLYVSESSIPACNIYRVEIDAPTPDLVWTFTRIGGHNYPPASLVSDPYSGALYSLECTGSVRASCYLYAITVGPTPQAGSQTLLATFYERVPSRLQLDAENQELYLSDPTGQTLFRCKLSNATYAACRDLHLNPHSRLVALAVDAPRRLVYAVDKPSYAVVRFETAEADAPPGLLGDPFEVLHQLRPEELPNDIFPQHLQLDVEAGRLYLRTATGIGRGVTHHATPAPYSPIEPVVDDPLLVAFALDTYRQRLHWVRSQRVSDQFFRVELWSAAVNGTDVQRLADWSTNTPSGPMAGVPVALHLEPPSSPANASVLPPAFWIVSGVSRISHWNGTVMRSAGGFSNYGRAMSTAYDHRARRLYVTGQSSRDRATIFVADVSAPVAKVASWEQDDSVQQNGIAASAATGELFAAQSGGVWQPPPPWVSRWNMSSSYPKRVQVLRAVPPVSALVDLQQPERPIYFLDKAGATLWTARSDGTGQRLTRRAFQAENVTASAIWIDSALQLIYWTEQRELDTRVANLETLGQVATVLLVPVANTQAVAIDDERGWIYWGDVTMGRVMRARLDGSGIERFWFNGISNNPLAVEPTTGDLITVTFSYVSNSAVVQRRSLSTGAVSSMLTFYAGSPIQWLLAVQTDPRHDETGCTRLWLGMSSSQTPPEGFVGTACAGDKRVTRVEGLSGGYPGVNPSPLLLLPYLGHCLPPTGLNASIPA